MHADPALDRMSVAEQAPVRVIAADAASLPTTRRDLLIATTAALLGRTSIATAAPNPPLDIDLAVHDEAGEAIPHVDVWGYLLPRSSPLSPGAADLRRLATRYRGSADMVTPFNRIVPGQWVLPMTDAAGRLRYRSSYHELEGSAAQRPARLDVGFAFLKRGFEPAFVDLVVGADDSIDRSVVLRRSGSANADATTWQAFDRLRFELSDRSGFTEISSAAQLRIAGLGDSLRALAEQAKAAGERAAAARAYARMQYLPAVRFLRGQPAGFAQADPFAESSWAWVSAAYELDPSDPYVASTWLFHVGAERFGGRRYDPASASEPERREFATYLALLTALMDSRGDQVWPVFHDLHALWYRKSSDPAERAKVVPLLEKLHREEPMFRSREALLRIPP